jgi:hypothetical protein
MMRFIISPARKVRRSAFKLKHALLNKGIKRVLVVKPESQTYRQRNTDVIVNWGNSNVSWRNYFLPPFTYNLPLFVAKSVNKLKAFKRFKDEDVSHPKWTTDPEEARKFKGDVVCRSILTGFGGAGIDIYPAANVPTGYKLYVEYKKKKDEYRVHIFNGKVIDVSQKKRRKGVENRDNQIRNYKNGWVYCRENIVVPEMVTDEAIKAVTVLGLDFGAADVIWNEKEQKAYVLEVNTAPGLEGTTLENYANAISNLVQDAMPRVR